MPKPRILSGMRPTGKLQGGTYVVAQENESKLKVDEAIVSALLDRPEKPHASNLGIPVAAFTSPSISRPFSLSP